MKTHPTRILLLAALLLGVILNTTATAADQTATWDNSTGVWTNSGKWSSNPLFPNNGNGGFTFDAIQNGGDLTMDQAITIEKFTFTDGTLRGTTTLQLNDLLTFTGGNMTGAGTVNATAGVTFSGESYKYIQQDRVLNMSGTSTWSNGTINLFYGTTTALNNLAGGTFTTTFDGTLESIGTFNNAGTFTKSGGTGNTTLSGGLTFNNTGVVNVNSGTLLVNSSGSHTGAFAIGTGSTIEFTTGTNHLNTGASITGAGTVKLTSGHLYFNTAVATSTPIQLTGGTLRGAGQLDLNSPLSFTSGTMTGAGTVNANAGVVFSGASTKHIQQDRVLNMSGTSTWSGGNINLFFGTTTALNNLTGSTFTTTFDGTLESVGTFNNAGTFTKSGGTGNTTLSGGLTFNNTGAVNVDSGTLLVNSSGSHTGSFAIGAGNTIEFTTGTNHLNTGTSITGAGTVKLTSGNLYFNTAVTTSTPFQISGGNLRGAGQLDLNSPLSFTSGEITDAGTVNANAGVVFSGTDTKHIRNDRVLNMSGTSTWSAGNIALFVGASTAINNLAGGTFTATADGTLGSQGAFSNSGTFAKNGGTGSTIIGGGVTFSNTGTVHVATGTLSMGGGSAPYNQSGPSSFTILESGTVLATSSLNLNGGTLKGNGTVQGSVIAGAGVNTIDPGFSPGVLTVNGNVTLSSTSTLAMEIGGLGQGTLYDYLDVNGVLTLAGILDLDMLNGFENLVTSSDVFTLATANSPILGSFSNVASGSRVWTNTHVGFDVWYGAGSIFDPNSLVITGAPEPSRVVLLMAGMAGLVMRRRRTVTKLELRAV
ncbi:PEP-CTERM sorting domain-containing protein [Prosthecobacter sp.]|uniref:PEP-CTERM sorting domain-containing protein n=1 Tax=Prosthecobacter sp. TaxID=1965333 RepID=UPI002AB91859|nr:PEP-CTERM sorting domain-containing protein [Prosthecobacter sp.]MDZ4401665.1 PEP-CTERM sorting domain-containing protein [Prosthecobacter sp.]